MVTARVTAAATGGTHVFVLATSAVVTGPMVELEAQFLPRWLDGTATVGVAPCCRLLLLWCQLWPTVPQHDSAQVWGIGPPGEALLGLPLSVLLVKEEHGLPRVARRQLSHHFGVQQVRPHIKILPALILQHFDNTTWKLVGKLGKREIHLNTRF